MRDGVLLNSVKSCHDRAWYLGLAAQETKKRPARQYCDEQRVANISLLVLKLPELNSENAKRAWESINNLLSQVVSKKIKTGLACELASVG